MICHMKVHIFSYSLDQEKISKSKIHIFPNYEQTDLKTAIVLRSVRNSIHILSNQLTHFKLKAIEHMSIVIFEILVL